MNTWRHALWRTGLAALAATLLLSACALPRRIDSEVQSFGGPTAPQPGASYRFERLPSQQARADSQDKLEAMAEAALTKVGLQRNDAQARYSVQLDVQMERFSRNPQRPPLFLRGPWGYGGYGPGGMWGESSLAITMEPPWYQYGVHLLMRDTATAQVAYETSAMFDGPWSDSDKLLPVLLDAALQDFPTPPAGAHKVVIELPANGKTAP